jgi:hypothetical protein
MDNDLSKKAEPPVKASGFASPAQGYEEEPIDFNRVLMANPAATFVMVCKDDSMASYGLPYGAQLVVDRSLTAFTPPASVYSGRTCGDGLLWY